MVTEDARTYDGGVEKSGMSSQQCLVDLKRGVVRAKSKLSDEMQEGCGWLLEKMREVLKELPEKGSEQLHRWSRDKEMLEELRLLAVRLQNR